MNAKNIQASVNITSIKQNDIYSTIVVRMFTTRVNLNNARVTPAFIDEIVNNSSQYIGLPLCVDKR